MVSHCAWTFQPLLLSSCSCSGDSWGGRVDWRPDVAGKSGYVWGMSLMVSLFAWASQALMLSCGSCHALTRQLDSRPDVADGSGCVWGMATTMSPFAWACQPLALSCGSCHGHSLSEPLDSRPDLARESGCVWVIPVMESPFAWASQPLVFSCCSCHGDSLSGQIDLGPNLAGESGFACTQARHVWNGPCPQGLWNCCMLTLMFLGSWRLMRKMAANAVLLHVGSCFGYCSLETGEPDPMAPGCERCA
ncbi:uncharacterized protein LOC117002578 [Catharus ustulatus]|uniref:uncharacterized protein LOC117002578 n=1 Tax=Catharus ustulatus TaxID=91951 RepID=UPI00140DDFDD|nr:uncharacterized protein LOC117002578 [Catharus ustulatus]